MLVISGVTACGGGYSGGGGGMTPLQPTMSFNVSPATIVVGQSAALTWTVSDASSCVASGSWAGAQALSGTQNVTPTTSGNVTYTLNCTAPVGSAYSGGGGGTTQQSVTLMVNPATAFVVKHLLADTVGAATNTDANLVNPWGIVFAANKPVWTANNGTQTSTLYDGNGAPVPAGSPLIVTLPTTSTGGAFNPTGIVANGSTDFVVSAAGNSGAALFIYSGEGGMIAGWAPNVQPTLAVMTYQDAGGAVYKGLALANNGSGNFLYATDFHNNKIDVFNAMYVRQPTSATSFQFVDPTLPAGYAPFGIQAIANGPGGAVQIYVAYAQQQGPDNHDNANGAGLGLVDIYDANGKFVTHLIPVGGALNAPWGLALAPSDFGTLSKTLLVGNFGDGKINGYDPGNGTFMGTVTDSTGAPFAVPGLWGIAFGNDALSQPHNTLYFAAGTNGEANGLYGRIDLPTL
jgi:uncharacterized protein (TIGR03118 family)